ncbi:MAG: caspase family protein [Bacteroidaceae bacterium]|nr:caspase family protein [Bacteroidaceae bacterium]
MRFLSIRKWILTISLCVFIIHVDAQVVTKETLAALQYIKNGYLEYGLKELQKSSKLNDIVAQYYVALCHEEGLIVNKDIEQAFFIYRRTAERGLVDAMSKLVYFYDNGIVVDKNEIKRIEWQTRYERRGGKNILPDFKVLYNEGLKYPENYSAIPNSKSSSQSEEASLTANNVEKSGNTTYNITYNVPIQKKVEPQNQSSNNTNEQLSDVDVNIPCTQITNEKTFVIIIANENYQEVDKVPFAVNDGKIFAKYCHKTLGIPKNNISFVQNATANNIKREIRWLSQILEQYKGDAEAIVFYAGHGIPDESTKDAFLLPVDGYGDDPTTGYSLKELYKTLGSISSKRTLVFLDACFSGTKRDGSMLASARGVAIKAKQAAPSGNMIVFSASKDDQTAYPYNEKGHGLFTYYLLKKIQETEGDVTLEDLYSYISEQVGKQSILVNRKAQTPSINISSFSEETWKSERLR